MSGEHAKYSPSSAERWINCPGSIALGESLTSPPGTSPQAEEGTAAHWLFENYNRRKNASHAPNGVELTEELKDTVLMSLGLMHQRVPSNVPIYKEYRCPTWQELGLNDPIIWGTADVVALADDRLWLVDLKYGKHPVSPEGNKQLLTYAVGLLDLVGDAYDDWSLAILQPRAPKQWRQWDIDLSIVKAWKDQLIDYFRCQPDGKIQEGQHCFFCPAKCICAKRLFDIQ
jgi:hypothetical protein